MSRKTIFYKKRCKLEFVCNSFNRLFTISIVHYEPEKKEKKNIIIVNIFKEVILWHPRMPKQFKPRLVNPHYIGDNPGFPVKQNQQKPDEDNNGTERKRRK